MKRFWQSGYFVATMVFLALCTYTLAIQFLMTGSVHFADDAYYYMVIANHVVHQGRSTFDGQTLTNGYHPLWLLALVLQYKVFSQSPLLTRSIEFALGICALIALLHVSYLKKRHLYVLYTLGFFAILNRVALNGMETSILVAAIALATYQFHRRSGDPTRTGVLDGLVTAVAIAARLDCALFLLPQLLLTKRETRSKWVAIGLVTFCGASYAAVNLFFFGAAAPISGEIKALGGWQLNHRFLALLKNSTTDAKLVYAGFAFFLLAILTYRITTRPALRAVLTAYIVGWPLFTARILFMSSWTIWGWYNYPLLIAYIGCAPVLLTALDARLGGRIPERLLLVCSLVAPCVFIGLGLSHTLQRKGQSADYYATNASAIQESDGLLQKAQIAMGDRAGNFAYQYGGGVTQLEGLVNDSEYLKLLHRGGEVTPLLCERGVRFVAAYEPDLGTYDKARIETIRYDLSQYRGPLIPVRQADQVAKVPNKGAKFLGPGGASCQYLYIWKLDCSGVGAKQNAGMWSPPR